MRTAASGPKAAVDLGPALAATLTQFRKTQQKWAESTTQDAIESVNRIAWFRQVRIGVEVPTEMLYQVPVRRAAQVAAARFVDSHIDVVASNLGVPKADLRLAATHSLEHAWSTGPGPSIRVHRVWNEREVPWRLRFESTLRSHLRRHGATPLEDLLEERLLEVVASWQAVSRARIASRKRVRYSPCSSPVPT